MINEDEKNAGILFLSLLNSKLKIEDCIQKSNLSAEDISLCISSPKFQNYFDTENNRDFLISCNFDWITKDISNIINISKSEYKIIENTVNEKLVNHISKYWEENGKVKRDFELRSLSEWIISEFVFVSGFAMWFREKEKKREIDISYLLTRATGEKIQASAKIEFDEERMQLVSKMPSQLVRKLMNISPAGKIAYRSLDMAVMKGMSEGDPDFAKKMKNRTNQGKKWWKFW